MASDDPLAQDSIRQIRIIGICWVIYGIIRLIAAVWLVSFSNTAMLMFGALLNRVPDPFTMMSVFHVFYTFLIALSVVCGALGIFAGWALLAGQRSGRTLALIAGFFSLSDIPLGLTLGIYSLVVLLPAVSRYASSAVLRDATPGLRHHPSAG
jgi:hypothetical protein